jgi:galactonate dehydratase
MSRPLRSASLKIARINPRTCWAFVEIERHDARIGTGEATLNGREEALGASAARLVPLLWQIVPAEAGAPVRLPEPSRYAMAVAARSLEDAAIVSAIDMALWDLGAQDRGMPLVDVVGGKARECVPLYANINRRTRDRSPSGFAQSARDARAAGFTALKIAPFDEVSREGCARGEGDRAMVAGLARIAATRDAAGPACRLMVDCHWRFDEATAARMIDAAAACDPYWIECPLPESAESMAALSRLRARAAAHGMRLAGLEQCVGHAGFRPFCEAGCYDVMMPDVKYVGGVHEMQACAQLFERHGVAMSPHNPSGPIAHAASLHLSAAMPRFDMLELQFDESPLFETLVGDSLAGCVAPIAKLPAAAGLGVRLAPAVLDPLREFTRRWEAP